MEDENPHIRTEKNRQILGALWEKDQDFERIWIGGIKEEVGHNL